MSSVVERIVTIIGEKKMTTKSTTKYNEEYIRTAAYYNWKNAGCPWGNDEYFWNMAIKQLYGSCKCSSSSCNSSNSGSSSKKATTSSYKTTSTVSSKTGTAKKTSSK